MCNTLADSVGIHVREFEICLPHRIFGTATVVDIKNICVHKISEDETHYICSLINRNCFTIEGNTNSFVFIFAM